MQVIRTASLVAVIALGVSAPWVHAKSLTDSLQQRQAAGKQMEVRDTGKKNGKLQSQYSDIAVSADRALLAEASRAYARRDDDGDGDGDTKTWTAVVVGSLLPAIVDPVPAIEVEVEDFLESAQLAGLSVAVIRDGNTVYAGGAGIADYGSQREADA